MIPHISIASTACRFCLSRRSWTASSTVDAQRVAVEAHLRWCRVCAARVEDMQTIGASLRLTSCAIRAADEADDSLASVQSDVLTRIGAEREHSTWAQLRGMCSDLRFFWPAIGATGRAGRVPAAWRRRPSPFDSRRTSRIRTGRDDSDVGESGLRSESDAARLRDGSAAAVLFNGGALDAPGGDDAVFAAIGHRDAGRARGELRAADV